MQTSAALSDHVLRVSVKDRNGNPIRGATLRFFHEQQLLGDVITGDDVVSLQINGTIPIRVLLTYGKHTEEVQLPPGADRYDFQLRNVGRASTAEKWFPMVFGTVFLLVDIYLVSNNPTPSPAAWRVYAATLSLAAAGIGAGLTGFLVVNFNPSKTVAVSAGGALALFVLIYFFTSPL